MAQTKAVPLSSILGKHWLDRYGSGYHHWRPNKSSTSYFRPLGLVEQAFNLDNSEFNGRADMTSLLTLEAQMPPSSSTLDDLKKIILVAWANLCTAHVLVAAKVKMGAELREDPDVAMRVKDTELHQKFFVFDVPGSAEEALDHAADSVVFMEDFYASKDVPADKFYLHAMNSASLVKPEKSLSTLLVLPMENTGRGTFNLRLLMVAAHQIGDGVSLYQWQTHFVHLLNKEISTILAGIPELTKTERLMARLAPAQEDLYAPIPGNKARRRWFWAISRVMYDLHKPQFVGFKNPLFKPARRRAPRYPPVYKDVLDYSARPKTSASVVQAQITSHAVSRLYALCKEAKASIGAGIFTLLGIVMMKLEEERLLANGLIRPEELETAVLPPFMTGFPINPRPFFNPNMPTPLADSLMLSFNDGLILPFLPSTLPLEARFKLLIRQAHRQLRKFRGLGAGTSNEMSQFIPHTYISSFDRLAGRLMRIEEDKQTINTANKSATPFDDDNDHTPRILLPTTCGISSLGMKDLPLQPGMYPLSSNSEETSSFRADFRSWRVAVRARDGEFLVGAGGGEVDPVSGKGGMGFQVSFDADTVEDGEGGVQRWVKTLEGLFGEWESQLGREWVEDFVDGQSIKARL